MHRYSGVLILVGSVLATPLAQACATCGCTLSTDAATGYSAQSGWRVDAEYAYLDQDELRHGNGEVSPAQIVNHPSDPALDGGEIERDTRNRYLNLGVSYHPNADWGFSALLPYVRRDHTTFGVQMQPFTAAEIAPDQLSSARVAGIGDLKLFASYQGFLPTHNFGVLAGVKLPTGRYGGENDDGVVTGHPVFSNQVRCAATHWMPACKPAPAAPTRSSARIGISRSRRISTRSPMDNSRRRLRIGWIRPAPISVPAIRCLSISACVTKRTPTGFRNCN